MLPAFVQAARHDVHMSDCLAKESAYPPEELEAIRLNLVRVSGAPDAWRGRATAAGGFMAAAGAASFWGLSSSAQRLDAPAKFLVALAALAFTAAVAFFLAAGVRKTPPFVPRDGESNVDKLERSAAEEAVPIRKAARLGATFGALAVALAAVGLIAQSMSPGWTAARVSFVGTQANLAAHSLCPHLTQPFSASVQDDGSDVVHIRVVGLSCGPNAPEFVVPRSEVVLTVGRQ